MANATFVSSEVASFWRYIASSLDRLVRVAQTIDPDGLHWTPSAPETNSIAVLVIHTLGNAEENILNTLCGQHVRRDRSEEFVDRSTSAHELAERWDVLRPEMEAALSQLVTQDLATVRPHPRRGLIPGREILIVVARHAAEHLGRAELTRDLWNAAR